MRNSKWVVAVLALLLVMVVLPACAKSSPSTAPAPAPTTSAPPKTTAPAPATTPPASPAASVIEWKAVSYMPWTSNYLDMTKKFIEKINTLAKGEFQIKILGATEVFPVLDQVEALRKGLFDLNFTTAANYSTLLTEPHALVFSNKSIPQQRKDGLNEFMNEIHAPFNLYWLGQARHSTGFYIRSNVMLKTPEDLKGLRFRTVSTYNDLFKALGIVGITMPPEDVYTAMERGTIDGFVYGDIGDISMKWVEVYKYRLDHKFWAADVPLLVNLNSWNKLPKHLQALLGKTMADMEPEIVDYYTKVPQQEDEKLRAKGIQFIKFSPADEKRFLDIAYGVGWAELQKNIKPDRLERLKKILLK